MPSQSLLRWRNERLPTLKPLETAHATMVGIGPGRRYVTQQINQALVMLLSSQFQGFCRDLHSECVDALASTVTPVSMQNVLRFEFVWGRKLETGNPNPGNLGSDFNRFGFKLFDALTAYNARTESQKKKLERLNVWRNAISHQDFSKSELDGKTTVSLVTVRSWRGACSRLAGSMDEVMRAQMLAILGISPW